jgi:hypothetical protein
VIHQLKSRPEFFDAIYRGERLFDIRFTGDRKFAVGDWLLLREHDTKEYTGRELARRVTNILRHLPGAGCAAEHGLNPEYAILSLEPL